FDFSRYMYEVLDVDPERRVARVQPGTVCDYLGRAAAPHGLRFGPDPSTHKSCSFGGMIGNNACGTHSVLSAAVGNGARTSDNLRSMKALTYDGVQLDARATPPEDLTKLQSVNGREGNIYRRLASLRDRYGDRIRERFPKIPRRV